MTTREALLHDIEGILRKDSSRMYSREEILNLLAGKNSDAEIDKLLAELEVASSVKESHSDVYAICRAGTVYYKWNKS